MSLSSEEVCSFGLLLQGTLSAGETSCVGFFIAKLLGFAILLGSVLLKAPQIFNIMSTKTVEGLSTTSIYLEIPTTLTNIVYNYKRTNPITSYGESIFISIQNITICMLIWAYSKPPTNSSHITSCIISFGILLVGMMIIPDEFIYLLPLSGIPLMISSRLTQIIANIQAGSTGQLSSITTFLVFAGSLARVFTTIQEVGWDLNILTGFGLSAVLSGFLLAQIVFYSFMAKSKITEKKTK